MLRWAGLQDVQAVDYHALRVLETSDLQSLRDARQQQLKARLDRKSVV